MSLSHSGPGNSSPDHRSDIPETRTGIGYVRPSAAGRQAGDIFYLNDGLIQLEVSHAEGNDVTCRIRIGGELRSRKGLNLPGIDLGLARSLNATGSVSLIAKQLGVDAVSQSFVDAAI